MAIDTPRKLEIESYKLISSMRPGDMISLNTLGWPMADFAPYKYLIMIKVDHERYYYIRAGAALSFSTTKMSEFALKGRAKLIRGGDHEYE